MLFQYVNGDGEPKPITSGDVNEYIKEATGGDFTAKHFRTWSASVIALEQMLKKAERCADHGEDRGRAGRRSARQYARDQPEVLCPSRLLEAVKEDPRDPLNGMERPRSPNAPVERGSGPARVPRAQRQAHPAAQANGHRRTAATRRQLGRDKPPLDCRCLRQPQTGRDGHQLARSIGSRTTATDCCSGVAVGAALVAAMLAAAGASGNASIARDPERHRLAQT